MNRLNYYHTLPDGTRIYGGGIDLDTADKWQTAEGTLYCSKSGVYVLDETEFFPARRIPDKEALLLLAKAGHRAPTKGKARLSTFIGVPIRSAIERIAAAEGKTMNKVVTEALQAHIARKETAA